MTDFQLTWNETLRNALHMTFSYEVIKFAIFLSKEKRKGRFNFPADHVFLPVLWEGGAQIGHEVAPSAR